MPKTTYRTVQIVPASVRYRKYIADVMDRMRHFKIDARAVPMTASRSQRHMLKIEVADHAYEWGRAIVFEIDTPAETPTK